MNKQRCSHVCAILAAALAALLSPLTAYAKPIKKQYEVTLNDSRVVKVSTSADRENVIVRISRPGEDDHVYHNYPQAATTVVKIGSHDLFRHYIDAKSVAGNDFNFRLEQVSGVQRRSSRQVEAIRRLLADDMRVLRAVRGYDDSADVLLAELAYVVLTYDDSIMDGPPPASYVVREVQPGPSGRGMEGAVVLKASARAAFDCNKEVCLGDCKSAFNACMGNSSISDKTVCYNDRSSCTNNCYKCDSQSMESTS